MEVRALAEVRHFYAAELGLSERALRAATWPEVAARLVAAQRSVRLCISRDLTELDIMARIMRRENYLIAMLNRGVLALNIPIPGMRRHVLLTKTLEWNLYWCILDPMFDDAFRVKQSFLRDPEALRQRLRTVALLNAALSPFLLVFLVIYFFMKNAEAIYHHPSTIGARRWSPLARWRLRELNELPCFLTHRLNAGHEAAERYVAQFPNYALSHVARFVAFVAGSFAAVLIALTLADERLLERDLAYGRQLVWWLALLGVILAAARALVIEHSTAAFDPGLALLEVAAHTHHLPRHWRGRAHTLEVQEEFASLFRYRALLFLEELASVVLTPVLLWYSLPRCVDRVLQFVEAHTVHIEGVGDACSLAAFDLRRHGNSKYGSPCQAPKGARSRQGKMEKSLVSFAAAYPTWEPAGDGREVSWGTLYCAFCYFLCTCFLRLGCEVSFQLPQSQLFFIFKPNVQLLNRLGEASQMFSPMPPGSPGLAGNAHSHASMQHSMVHPMVSLLKSQYPHLAKLYLRQHFYGGTNGLYDAMAPGHSFAQQGEAHSATGPAVFRMASVPEDSLFRSAEVHAGARSVFALGMDGLQADERVVLGQAMLQSYYEQRTAADSSASTDAHDSGGDHAIGDKHAIDNHRDYVGNGAPKEASFTSKSTAAQPVPAVLPHSSSSHSPERAVGWGAGTPHRFSVSPGSHRSPQVLASELSVLSRQTSEAREGASGGDHDNSDSV